MKYLSVCSGIEAASVAWSHLGWKAAAFCEFDKFPSAVLTHHWPDIPNLGDMTKWRDWPEELLTQADILAGGTPCQAFSVAGLRNSLADERGNLTLTYVHILDQIDQIRARDGRPPAVCVWENVPGVLNTDDNAFGCFLAGLAGENDPLQPPGGRWTDAGYVRGPKRAIAWRSLDAQYFGLAQRRQRVFVVASAREGFRPEEVLFEFEGMRRNYPPCRSEGQGIAGTLEASVGSRGYKDNGDPSANLITGPLCSNGKAAGSATQQDAESGMLIVHGTQDPCTDENLAFALGRNAGQENAIAFSCKDHGADAGDVSPTLRSMGHHGSHPNGGGQIAVAFSGRIRGDDGRGYGREEQVFKDGITGPVDTVKPHCVAGPTMQVRRLMPLECARLQGFPDNHCDIRPNGKPTADGPQYKAYGNSMAVPVMLWIGQRIQARLLNQ